MGERLTRTIGSVLREGPWAALLVVWYAFCAVFLSGFAFATVLGLVESLGASPPPPEIVGPSQLGLAFVLFAAALFREWRRKVSRSDAWLLDHGRGELVGLDDFGALWVLEPGRDFAPRTVLVVHDATPQPDGSRRRYILRVPHDVQMPRDAVAWTFGFEDGSQFRPLVET